MTPRRPINDATTNAVWIPAVTARVAPASGARMLAPFTRVVSMEVKVTPYALGCAS